MESAGREPVVIWKMAFPQFMSNSSLSRCNHSGQRRTRGHLGNRQKVFPERAAADGFFRHDDRVAGADLRRECSTVPQAALAAHDDSAGADYENGFAVG